MRILPVIDLLDGLVVRGVAGRRAEYRPIASPLVADARPQTVARAFRERFGFTECYVADLDAIAGKPPNREAWRQIADCEFGIWLDAGVGTLAQAREVLAALQEMGAGSREHRMVVGLESLTSLQELNHILQASGADRIAFSLDLKAGSLLSSAAELLALTPFQVVSQVAALGIRHLIVLDLADVGVPGGSRTLELCSHIHAEFPEIQLIAGGGVRHVQDVQQIAKAGCAIALVASSLHDGRLSPDDCRAVESWE